MYGRKISRRPRRKYIRRARAAKKRVSKPSRTFARKVQSVINKNAEDKMAYHSTGDTLVSFNSGISAQGDIQKVVPNITNGTGDNQRIGDEIRAKRLNIRGYLHLGQDSSGTDNSNKRIAVRMLVVQPKRYPAWIDSTNNYSNWLQALIKKGGTQSYFTGQIQDLFAPVDTDVVTKMYDRVFYMSQDTVTQVTGTSTPTQFITQDNRHTIKFFNINIPCRNKIVRYDPSHDGDVSPTNWGPVLILGYAHLDNSSPDVVSARVGLCYDSTFYYQDM